VESRFQKARYVDYTRDKAFKAIIEYGHWRANPRLVRAIVNESGPTIDWLEKHGVEFGDVTINMVDAPQVYHIVKGDGAAAIKALVDSARKLGIEIFLGTPVKQIIKSGGKVAGVVGVGEEDDVLVQA
jgi:fumarate reductase flavoprotein subunit